MIPTFRPWTHTSDDSYIYQLSLVLATATVSLLLLGLLPYLLPSDRLIIVYSYHYTYLVSNNYTAIGRGIYITKTLCLRIYWPQYVHTYPQCYTLVVVVRAVWNWGWQREWSFSVPIVLLFVVVLRIFTGRNTFVPAALDHTPCMVGCVCPVESRMTKRVVFYCFDHYE